MPQLGFVMTRMPCFFLTIACAALVSCTGSQDSSKRVSAAATAPPPADQIPGATLIPGLGDYHFPISSTQPDVQRWFDQGLMLTYGFNHDAAERSFLRAAALDPDCAMCLWGAALVLGPHVNAGMEPANNAKAWTRLQRARALAANATLRAKAFIPGTRRQEWTVNAKLPLPVARAPAGLSDQLISP